MAAAPIPFGRYLLVDKLAAGGMAELFLARAQGPGGFSRLCVVKRVLPHLTDDPRFIEMFLDEARLAASLNHPNIVQIYELGKERQDYYIAMEYLAGEDVHQVMQAVRARGEQLPVPLVLKLIATAAEALHFAHEQRGPDGRALQIVHRDVSPSNLFVTYQGTLKVLDFGIAHAASRSQRTEAGSIKGKAGYLSPEQALSQDVDRRADVFALGVCLHELLTGQRLFEAEGLAQSALAVCQKPIPRPSSLRAGLSPEVDGVVMKALARKREDRTPTAERLAEQLEGCLQSLGAHVQPRDMAAYLKDLFGEARVAQRLRRDSAEVALPGSVSTEALSPHSAAGAPRFMASGARRPLRVWVPSALAALMGAWFLLFVHGRPPSDSDGVPKAPVVSAPAPSTGALTDSPRIPDRPAARPEFPAEPEPEPQRAEAPPAEAKVRERRTGVVTPSFGFVSLTSNVPVQVYSGRQALGASPLKHVRLAPGLHHLRLSNTRLGISREVPVRIRAGGETQEDFTFRKGELNVNVTPWADVWLDGVKLGQTPLAAREVWEGRHALRLASPLGEKRRVIQVKADEPLTIQDHLP